MRRYRVEITAVAEGDIEEIFAFIAQDDPGAARRWVLEVERQISTLEQFPLRCPIIPEARDLGRSYRHLVHGNYRTIFTLRGRVVVILRVIHGARLLDFGVLISEN